MQLLSDAGGESDGGGAEADAARTKLLLGRWDLVSSSLESLCFLALDSANLPSLLLSSSPTDADSLPIFSDLLDLVYANLMASMDMDMDMEMDSQQQQQQEEEGGGGGLGDWHEVYDEEGNLYYENAVTGETSWDPPASPSAAGAAGA